MDVNNLGKALLEGFKMIAILIGIIVGSIMALVIGVVTVGVLFQLVLSGDIAVSGNSSMLLYAIEGNFNTLVGKLTSAMTFGGGLIPLVIVILVLGGGAYAAYTKYVGGKKSKKGKTGGY